MRPACEISSGRRSPDGRRVLAETELPLEEPTEPQVCAWLEETLSPLNLESGFVERILDSARDAVMRLAAFEEAAAQQGHIHVLISGPQQAGSAPETWGFFRIEKLEGTAQGEALPDHSIEFYLYVEGD